RVCGILASELIAEIKGQGSPAAVIIDTIVADTPPVGARLQTVTANELGNAPDNVPRVRHVVGVIAAGAHLVARIVVLEIHGGESRPRDGRHKRSGKVELGQTEAEAARIGVVGEPIEPIAEGRYGGRVDKNRVVDLRSVHLAVQHPILGAGGQAREPILPGFVAVVAQERKIGGPPTGEFVVHLYRSLAGLARQYARVTDVGGAKRSSKTGVAEERRDGLSGFVDHATWDLIALKRRAIAVCSAR